MPKFESGKKEEIAEKQTHACVSADLYLELMVERDFREKGGLIFGSHCTAAGTVVGEQIYLFPKYI